MNTDEARLEAHFFCHPRHLRVDSVEVSLVHASISRRGSNSRLIVAGFNYPPYRSSQTVIMSAVPNLFSRVKIRVKRASKPRGQEKSADEVAAERIPVGVSVAPTAVECTANGPAWDADPPSQVEEEPVTIPASPRGA